MTDKSQPTSDNKEGGKSNWSFDEFIGKKVARVITCKDGKKRRTMLPPGDIKEYD